MQSPAEPHGNPTPYSKGAGDSEPRNDVDVGEIIRRTGRGLGQILGLALLGMAAAGLAYLVSSGHLPISTSTRVVFSFPGYAKGQYPDGSKFSPDDVAATDVIADAIKRVGFDQSSDFQTRIRSALSVEGVIPADISKARDHARALGEVPSAYVPDEFVVSLTLGRNFPLDRRQRGILLNAIINAYRAKFERTYVDVPLAFGNAFETLKNADYFEYEQVLPEEVGNITSFLKEKLDEAKNYRSPTTNLSFSDLLDQTELFSQIRLNEILGIIRANGLSRNRQLVLVQMNYFLRTLQDQEREAIEDESVIRDLLAKSESHSQGYVLGVKSEVAEQRPSAPMLDQGLIDSLLANDAYSLLVRRALDAGLNVKHIQSEEAKLKEQIREMEISLQSSDQQNVAAITQVNASLDGLKAAYDELVDKIRKTQADYSRQEFADAITLSDGIYTEGMIKPLAESLVLGLLLGGSLGAGLSLLGIYTNARET